MCCLSTRTVSNLPPPKKQNRRHSQNFRFKGKKKERSTFVISFYSEREREERKEISSMMLIETVANSAHLNFMEAISHELTSVLGVAFSVLMPKHLLVNCKATGQLQPNAMKW